jgi:hypothetical protein
VWSAPAGVLLDRVGPARTKRLIGLVFGLFLRGGRRVDDDPDGSMRARALLDHFENGDVHALCLQGSFRDDVAPGREEVAFASVSPRGNLEAIAASGAAVFSYGGWLDGGYAQAAVRRFASLERTELLLGPWGHAGFFAHDPAAKTAPAAFPHETELLRFFDRELRGRVSDDPPVRYFTLVENTWKRASSWPPPRVQTERWHLSGDRTLSQRRADARPGPIEVLHDPSFGTGERSRWRGLLAGFVPADYPDFTARIRRQAVLTSPRVRAGMVVTGHPVLRLGVRGEGDWVVMAYLADVDVDGRATYVTEGQLRAAHRVEGRPERGYRPLGPYHSFERAAALPVPAGEVVELSFSLLPTSYWIRPGHRLALVVTLGDADHFVPLGAAGRMEIVTERSSLDLPTERA